MMIAIIPISGVTRTTTPPADEAADATAAEVIDVPADTIQIQGHHGVVRHLDAESAVSRQLSKLWEPSDSVVWRVLCLEEGTTVVAPETEEAVVAIETIHQTATARALAAAEVTEDPRVKDERRSCRVSRLPPWQVRPKPFAHAKSPADGPVPKASVS
jgi:hypothetical protein